MHRTQKYSLLAGAIPLPWFLFWTTLGGLQAPQYSAISQHGSELLSLGGPAALCLKVAAIGSGLAFIAFGAGVWASSTYRFAPGALAWILFGLAMVSNGVWPMGNPMHGLYALGIANLVAPALAHLEIAPRLQCQRFYALTALVSTAGIAYLWLNLTGQDPEAYRGFTQRLFSSINSLWPLVVGITLSRGSARSDA
jgi:Protein of unknown function (DUF998)